MMRTTSGLACVVAALLFAACGGGGGGGGTVALPSGGIPGTGGGDTGGGSADLARQLVVVQFDHDGDDRPDVLTLDRNTSPMEIVEALRGTAGGDAVDVTKDWAGQTVDAAISDAVNSHLIDTFSVGGKTDVFVTDTLGHDATVTIFD